MQANWKNTWTIAAVAFLLGAVGASYFACKFAPAKPAEVVTKTTNLTSHDTTVITNTVYLKGKPYPVPVEGQIDTVHTLQVDTVREVSEHTTLRIDTVFLQKYTDILAAFQARGHLIELRAGAEHDVAFGGYGGQVSLQLNLEKLHIANIQPFFEVGYLHSPHVTLGVQGTIGGAW